MATTTPKQKMVNQLFGLVKNGRATEPLPERPVLEQFIYAVCREDATREAADQAYRNLQDGFYDWNEIRVSSEEEIAEALADLSDAVGRARRIRDFLQEVFEKEFCFNLDPLQKKGLKQAAKALASFSAANDYAVAWVVQQSLGGHAIPLDVRSVRVLKRMGLLEAHESNAETLRASLEHQVPKAKGLQFVDVVSELAEASCWTADPACPSCPMNHGCVTGAVNRHAAVPAKKSR